MGLLEGFGLDDVAGDAKSKIDGVAADYGHRWQSVAANAVKGLLGLNKRPWQYELQVSANARTPPGSNSKGYLGHDNYEYPLDFGDSMGEMIRSMQDGFSDITSFVHKWMTDPLGNLFGGSQWSYPHDRVFGSDRREQSKGGRLQMAAPARKIHHVPTHRYNQMLEDKGFLEVEYPNGMNTVRLPFFENPKIDEKRKANYSSLKVFNRNEPIRLFTGAEARSLTLNFAYTVPHIMEFGLHSATNARLDPLQRDIFISALDAMKKNTWGDNTNWLDGFSKAATSEFTAYQDSISNYEDDALTAGKEHIDDAMHNHELISALENIKIQTPYNSTWGVGYDARTASEDFLGKNPTPESEKNYRQVLHYVDYLTNAVRTLVVGAVNTPNLGPPITYLNFGTMYRNVPCICTNYSISVDPDTGYDTDTLIPRRISFSMELEEIRQDGKVGFGAYNPVDANEGLPGWEDFHTQGSMDPASTEATFSDQTEHIKRRYD